MELRIRQVLSVVVLCLTVPSVTSQFYSDYSDGGGEGVQHPYDIPVVYKEQNYPPAYPVAPSVYAVTLMKPIEAMPGKKTVPLYIISEDSLEIGNSNRIKRSHSHGQEGPTVHIKYPEFFGLTDGFHIPAVEIPLNRPMVVRQIEVNVLAPSGFMVPFQGDDREWPYPMNTGCLVGTIPRNTYVSEDQPITIRKLYAVPSLPEYPTYRTVPNRHSHHQLHGHQEPPPPSNEALANYFTNRAPVQIPVPVPVPVQYQYAKQPKAPQPVFELVPITQKSSRRNSKRRNSKRKKEDSDEEDDDKRDSDEDSRDHSDEDRRGDRARPRGRERDRDGNKNRDKDRNRDGDRNRDRDGDRNRDRDEDRNRDRDGDRNRDRDGDRKRDRDGDRNRDQDGDRNRNRDRDDDRDRTTTTTTTTTPRTTPTTTTRSTTTTAASTTAAASNIQDIIAAFSSYQNRPYEDRHSTRTRLSNAFKDNRDDRTYRYRDDERSSSKNSEELPSPTISSSEIQGLRQQMLQKQITQLQKLLTSLNLSTDSKVEN